MIDLEVPASAEIVIEQTISDDPATYETEGPFGRVRSMKVTCITQRRDPIFVARSKARYRVLTARTA